MRSSNLSYELVTGEDHSIDRCHLHNREWPSFTACREVDDCLFLFASAENMALAVDGHKVMEKRLKM